MFVFGQTYVRITIDGKLGASGWLFFDEDVRDHAAALGNLKRFSGRVEAPETTLQEEKTKGMQELGEH